MSRFRTAIITTLVCFFTTTSAAPFDISCSSIHSNDYLVEYALDNNPATRWASIPNQPTAFVQVDLGQSYPMTSISVTWEYAYAQEYNLAVSDNAKDWTVIATEKNGRNGKITHSNLNAQGRYLRVNCLKYGPHPLYSIWEIQFNDSAIAQAQQKTIQQKIIQQQKAVHDTLETYLAQNDTEEIIFTQRHNGTDPHWYANFGYYAENENRKTYKNFARLCKYNLKTQKLTVLLEDSLGTIRDPQVHYDAQKIIFSYRKGGTDFLNLYEINTDGTGLKQITTGEFDDIEPTYLPDGGIIFASSRAQRWVNCWLTPVATLYRCDADGTNIRQLSTNIEQDNTPWPLPDGRILYTRWEYIDRSQVDYHHLWAMNPDGTNQTIYYGNMHPTGVFIDAKPIPNSNHILMIDSPGHGATEHTGYLATVSNNNGPDDLTSKIHINESPTYRDPYPLNQNLFLAASNTTIQLINSDGKSIPLYQTPNTPENAGLQCHEPRPITPRQREHIIPNRTDPTAKTGKLLLLDVYAGRHMQGVKKGSIKNILIVESLAKPINFTGGMDPLTYGGSFTLEHIVGTVPVEPDGSAYMELPANRSLFFIALDENDNAVKRMQSFTSVAPGEITSCVGCHENRKNTPTSRISPFRQAIAPTPIADIPAVFDFPRDIQPILDKHCVSCHNPDKYRGKINLSGDHGPMFSLSYASLTIRRQIVDGRNEAKSNLAPYSIGAYPSPLMKKILNHHHGVNLSQKEIDYVRYWIETAATYPGTYAALGTGMIGGYQENNQVINNDTDWPESQKASQAITATCTSCHKDNTSLAKNLSDENGLSFWRPDWNDKRLRFSRHVLFNLTQPEKSLILKNPLARSAGGFADDSNKKRHPVIFKDTNDPTYQAILAMVRAGQTRLNQVKRFDMPDFQPRYEYLREMKKYGILPADFDPKKDKTNPYLIEKTYWKLDTY